MTIDVISMWYNEAFLAPLFFDHYRFADRILLLLDRDTTDGTRREIALAQSAAKPKIEVLEVGSGDGMDDVYKRDVLNEAYRRSRADWVIMVDADEFVFVDPLGKDTVPAVLAREQDNVLVVDYWAVFRHVSEQDIDRAKPALLQRRHGIKEGVPEHRELYQKPAVARPGAIAGWDYGIHKIAPLPSTCVSRTMLMGAHWWLPDYAFAVQRMLRNRRDRQGRRNTQLGLTAPRYASLTEDVIRQLYEQHLNDPQLF